jgi:hypothetical protein
MVHRNARLTPAGGRILVQRVLEGRRGSNENTVSLKVAPEGLIRKG